MRAFEEFMELRAQKEQENTRQSHISFVEGDKKIRNKYHEHFQGRDNPLKVMLHGRFEIGAIVYCTTYSPDMDTSSGARLFKINPNLSEEHKTFISEHFLFAEDLLKIASKIDSVNTIPKNSGE